MQINPQAKKALLVIDMQIGQCSVEPLPYQRDDLLDNINQLIRYFHQIGQPVFFIRHAGPAGSPFAAGEAIWNVVPELNIDPAQDVFIDKTRASCFDGTPLASKLKENDIQDVVIAGLKTQYCVDTACRSALALGFKPILVSDAHSCINTAQLAAADIIAHHNTCLNGPIARVMPTAELCQIEL